MLIDPDKGPALAVSLFDTVADMRTGAEVLNAMSPSGEGLGRRTSVGVYEVGVDVRS